MEMKGTILVIFLCIASSSTEESFENSSRKIALGVFGDCSSTEDFYVCLKKKAITLLDRLGRAEKFTFSDNVKVVRSADAPKQKDEITEAKLDEILPRSAEGKNAALTEMLSNKVSNFLGSRTIQISLPRAFQDDDDNEEFEDESEEGKFRRCF